MALASVAFGRSAVGGPLWAALRPAVAGARGSVASRVFGGSRAFLSSTESPAAVRQCQKLADSVVAANWADSVKLVQDVPFWESAMHSIERTALADLEAQKHMKELQRIFDCLYEVEDARDHINELLVHLDRATGLAGTGVNAFPGVANVEEHIDVLKGRYEELRAKYRDDPTLLYKVDEVVGGGMATLRQKKRFTFVKQSSFYY